jgi:hypothetical protein
VIDEEEQFTELASSEFLSQQLRTFLEAGGRETLDSLPDGIHSGLAKESGKGVFFYFQAKTSEGKLHFWKYFDMKDERIIDNRYLIANLIACERDTPRVVEPEMFRKVFEIQEKVIEDILRSFEKQKALEVAPRSVDPIQQTLATIIQGYMNHPSVDRRRAVEAIRFLNQPMLTVQVRNLRQAYKDFQAKPDIDLLIGTVEGMLQKLGGEQATHTSSESKPPIELKRDDLRLICFDFVSGG